MLHQYLISNQSVELDNSFKIFVKILSIEHMKQKSTETRQHKKRTKAFYQRKKHYGGNMTNKKNNYFWAQEVPISFSGEPHKNYFFNKCLLICTVLGILQNQLLTNQNTKFVVVQRGINSINVTKQKMAGYILVEELNKIISNLNISEVGPYELEKTCLMLSNYYNCQKRKQRQNIPKFRINK